MFQVTPVRTKFKSIPNDPIKVKHYTLANGLQLFMTVNKEEPRIYTEIAVRAGSKHDPAETTGLAHYFEHMMFKGTDRLGCLNWAKEKPILDQISQLFERHRAEKDPEKKALLYAEIDRLSFEAAKLVAANEYDKLVSAIGAKGTNAYTWVEQTVYVNDIPSNELERWFWLESERFRNPILRLFHTELETVFEEYNINQDRDFRKVMKAAQLALTPTHPYGTQTTLGRGEDLKNPSQENIYAFFQKYYVPNNMAIAISGDFAPEEVVALAEKYFGHYEKKKVPVFKFKPQPEITSRIKLDVLGQEAPWVEMSWRFPGANSEAAKLLPLIAGILYNQQAGLLDLNLAQRQKVLECYAYPRIYEDYSALVVYAKPRDGQSLEAVEQLLLEQIQLLLAGKFEEWLPAAVIKDMRRSEIMEFEKNTGRASAITGAFILGLPWREMVTRWDFLEAQTRETIAAICRQNMSDRHYVVVYKHHGVDASVMKVEKPPITPVELNRSDLSEFAQSFLEAETPDIDPVFLNFKKLIKRSTLSPKVDFYSIRQKDSRLFRLYYILEMGKSADKKLAVAASYLQYLGTEAYSPAELQQAFYRLGLVFSVNVNEDRIYLSLTGLDICLEEGVILMEHLLSTAKPNPEALENLVADILMKRENAKKDKRTVLTKALFSYAKHGKKSPFTDILSKSELKHLVPEELTELVRGFKQYEHKIFYCGPSEAGAVKEILNKNRQKPSEKPLKVKKGTQYKEQETPTNQVLFVHFPMVQVELMLLSKGTPHFNLEEFAFGEWYNQYFGYGLSSIVFQDIRESKALAYAAYAYAASPQRKKKSHHLQAYVGTQPDKLKEAVDAFQKILEDMPVSESQVENARIGVMKQIAADRITKADIFWNWRSTLERGYKEDLRQHVYETVRKSTVSDLVAFQKKYVKGRAYTWLVMGERDRIDFEFLNKIGPVQEVTLREIFGY